MAAWVAAETVALGNCHGRGNPQYYLGVIYMKYYELMRSADNAAGADFAYCTNENLDAVIEDFKPTFPVDEISKEEYEEGIKMVKRRGIYQFTGKWI